MKRARGAGDRVQRRQDQREDQHHRDDVVEHCRCRARAEDLRCEGDEDRPRVDERRVAERREPDHDDERDRDQGVDEGAVAALEVERDLRVLVGVPGLADVARGGLHRDHVPGQKERERDVQRQPAVAVERREEARAVDVLEAGELAEVDDRRIEDPGDREERQRDHREHGERGREERPEAQAPVGGNEQQHDADDRDRDRPPSDRRPEQRDPAGGVEVEQRRDVEGREDHVERRDREPAEPVAPGGDPVDVLGEPRPAVLVRDVRISGRAARAVGHHRRELRQEQAQQPAAEGDHQDHRHRRRAELHDHHRRDAGHEDRAGEADHECTPPVAGLRQAASGVAEFVLFRHRHIRHACSFPDSRGLKSAGSHVTRTCQMQLATTIAGADMEHLDTPGDRPPIGPARQWTYGP